MDTPPRYLAPRRRYAAIRQQIAPQIAEAMSVQRSIIACSRSNPANDCCEPSGRLAVLYPLKQGDTDHNRKETAAERWQAAGHCPALPYRLDGHVVASDPAGDEVAQPGQRAEVLREHDEEQGAGERSDDCIPINARDQADRGHANRGCRGDCSSAWVRHRFSTSQQRPAQSTTAATAPQKKKS